MWPSAPHARVARCGVAGLLPFSGLPPCLVGYSKAVHGPGCRSSSPRPTRPPAGAPPLSRTDSSPLTGLRSILAFGAGFPYTAGGDTWLKPGSSYHGNLHAHMRLLLCTRTNRAAIVFAVRRSQGWEVASRSAAYGGSPHSATAMTTVSKCVIATDTYRSETRKIPRFPLSISACANGHCSSVVPCEASSMPHSSRQRPAGLLSFTAKAEGETR